MDGKKRTDGAQRHDERLMRLHAALRARRKALLAELAEVDRDMEALWRAADAELRQRQRDAALSGPNPGIGASPRLAAASLAGPPASHQAVPPGGAEPAAAIQAVADDGPVQVRSRTPFPGKPVPPLAALATLGPPRDDRAVPPAVDAKGQRLAVVGMPTGGAALAEAKAAVRGIADQARKAPPGPGGRRILSSRGLVPGEPVMPSLRNVLRAAGRPLTSAEATLAMLEARGINREGPELVAVVNRTSALFGQEAVKGKMRRIPQEGSRAHLWELTDPEGEPPLDAAAHMRGRKS